MKKRFIQIGSFSLISLLIIIGLKSGKVKLRDSSLKYKPLKVAVLADRQDDFTNSLVLGEYYILQRWMEKTGGIIGYASITENSSQTRIHRLEIEKNKAVPFFKSRSKESPLSEDLKNLYRHDSIHKNSWGENLNRFLNELINISETLISGEIHSPNIDIVGIVNRAITFLCEEEVSTTYSKYLVIYSEMEDNVGNEFSGLPCEISVLVINSSATSMLGEKLGINYLVFESFSSALNYIVEKEAHTPNSITYLPFFKEK
jgi:hypothetical protein